MHKNIVFFLFYYILFIFSAVSCDNMESIEATDAYHEQKNKHSYFEQLIGYGWYDVRMYDIDPITGIQSKDDVLGRDNTPGQMGGGWYYGWYFAKDTLTTYIDANYIPAYGFRRNKISFNENCDSIYCEGVKSVINDEPIPSLIVESVEGDTLRAKILAGKRQINGTYYDYYSYGIFVRMTPDRLQEVREKCDYDLDIHK